MYADLIPSSGFDPTSKAPLDLLALRSAVDPKGLAVVDCDSGVNVTWEGLQELVLQLSGQLGDAGIAVGHPVATVAPAGLEFVVAAHACLQLGAVLVPLSARAPAAALVAPLIDSGAGVLLAVPASMTVAEKAGSMVGARLLTLAAGTSHGPTVEGHGVAPAADLAILYTSGTTGPPKGVRQTLGNHLASAFGCRASLGSQEGERWLLALSPHHVGGYAIVLRSVVSGQPIVSVGAFDEVRLAEAIRRHRPRLVSLVPAQLRRLIAAGLIADLRRVRAILLGGAPAGAAEVREWIDAGLPVCPSYGLTETCSQACTVPPGRALEMIGTAGPPHPFARVEVRESDAGRGEVWVGGAVLSPGYRDPRVGDRREGAMFATADAGELTPEGWLRVTGRLDNVVITGGENVHPEEIEALLVTHPGVTDVAVLGLPDPLYGRRLAAVVVGEVDPPALAAWARLRLPGFKVPRSWAKAEALPRTDSGKLLRSDLGEFF
ncbi:MAG: class I adenylate-forming enzyme family protein [Candidatus Dormibacteria bacterium]